MTELIIAGAGGFGREVYHWIQDWIQAKPGRENQYRIKGFLSIDRAILDGFDLPVGILGDEESYSLQPGEEIVVAIGNPELKKKVVNALAELGATFFSLIHPTAVISPSATIGKGVVVCPFVCVCAHATIGDFVTCNIYSSLGHDATVGNYVVLSPYSTLNGFATLDDDVFMGTHATVVASKTVGRASRVSANTLVVRNVPPETTVLGNPGKMMPNL